MIDDQNKIITVEVDKSKELNIFGLDLLLFKVLKECKVRSNVPRPRKAKYVQGEEFGEMKSVELEEHQE